MATNTLEPHIEPPDSSASQPITAQNVHKIFPDIGDYLAKPKPGSEPTGQILQNGDAEQIEMMEREYCIIVDEDDKPIGSASKKTSHLMENISKGLLHRAFSVFLFDKDDRLLLQQRAEDKFTFKNMWTNTCCSHPLNVPDEAGVDLKDAIEGAKAAAIRKLDHELNIKLDKESMKDFHFLARIHYLASSEKVPNEIEWGEHEIDYILFIKTDVPHKANPREAQDTKYVTEEELKTMMAGNSLQFTPWFKLICRDKLYSWWDVMRKGGKFVREEDVAHMREERKGQV